MWGCYRGSSPGLSFYLPSKVQHSWPKFSRKNSGNTCPAPCLPPNPPGTPHSQEEPPPPATAEHTSSVDNILHAEPSKPKKKPVKLLDLLINLLWKPREARFSEAVGTQQLPLFQVGVVWHSQLLKGCSFT